jgi:sugar phosphate isomerase/epimerase
MPQFTVGPYETFWEIGWAGCRLLGQLRRRLGIKNKIDARRMAPSPVIRSEAQVFGASMPRFAIRCYLDAEHRNFVNLRRIGTFCDRLQRWGGRRAESKRWCRISDIKEDPKGRAPAWVVRESSCIGDSVLNPPAEVDRQYHVLKAELGRMYGETPRENGELIGTPFIHHIHLSGGGLCAQAVCFMAATLCHTFLTGAHGVAEITLLVASGGRNEVRLSGLNYRQIALYLRMIGSSALWQRSERHVISPQHLFATSLRGYVNSGIPVILLTDMGRMYGQARTIDGCRVEVAHQGIYDRNDLWHSLKPAEKAIAQNHAVLLVGCARDSHEEFLINDPAAFPFLMASASQLWDAASYRRQWGGVDGPDEDSKADPSFYLNHGMFLPVTPGAVKLCLQHVQGDASGVNRVGLFHLAQFQRYPPSASSGSLPRCTSPTYERGHFQLQHVPEWRRLDLIPGLSACITECGDLIHHHIGARWCWLQYVPRYCWPGYEEVLWVWDAERENPQVKPSEVTEDLGRQFLLLVLVKTAGQWKIVYHAAAPPPMAARRMRSRTYPDRRQDGNYKQSHRASTRIPLGRALIASFSQLGTGHAAGYWPAGIRAAELYLLMQTEAAKLLPRRRLGPCQGTPYKFWLRALWKDFLSWSPLQRIKCDYADGTREGRWRKWYERRQARALRWPLVTAMDRMAALQGSPRVDEIAKRVAAPFTTRGVRVVALATFLPEIVSSSVPVAANAQRALMFSVEIGYALRRLGHPVKVIEMVSGSVIDGVWRSQGRHSAYIANRMGFYEAARRLRDNLCPVAQLSISLARANSDGTTAGTSEPPISLAIELEPGPLNVANSLRRLTRLSRLIEEREELAATTGFNLDVAHFALANISPDEVWYRAEIRSRIVHAHLSDSSNGHYGDIVPLQIRNREFFVNWLELIQAISGEQRRNDRPAFSRYVSLELESCKSSEHVRIGADELVALLPG